MAAGTWVQRFEPWAEGELTGADVPGTAVAVAEGGRPTYFHGFGLKDRERGLPLTADTVFGIGSVTKSFTAMAILQLQERGRLSVDDPVARYIPELRVPYVDGPHAMRLHHLLTHTSGLPPLPTLMPAMLSSLRRDPGAAKDMGLPEETLFGEAVDTKEQMVAFLGGREIRPLGRPGEVFSYSNDGYALLGLIVERVSGEPYERFVERCILEPAGMTRSGFDLSRVGDDITAIYAKRPVEGAGEGERKQEAYASPVWWESPAMAAAGFLRASASDMLRYLEIFRTGGMVGEQRILQPESVAAMTACHAPCDVGVHYGYGVMVVPDRGGYTLIEHGGAVKGVAAHMAAVPERGLTVVALANVAGAPSSRMTLGAINAYLDLPCGAPRVELPDHHGGTGDLGDLAATYVSEEGASIGIEVHEGGIVAVMGGERQKARRVGERAFAVPFRGGEMVLRFRTLDGEPCVTFGYRVLRRAPAPAEAAS